jgi:hypothetical protein
MRRLADEIEQDRQTLSELMERLGTSKNQGELPQLGTLDLDGTRVDTNYPHAIAWFRAFTGHEIVLPIWRIHRHIGMGGDQLIEAVCGERVDRDLGERIRSAEAVFVSVAELFDRLNDTALG